MTAATSPEKKAAQRAGLVYASDTAPGIRRKRSGKGFAYQRARGGAVRDARTLERIRKLAIPPAYTDVWINADARGHIQATGRDARGRKQYRYHPDWSQERDTGKFDRTVAFATAMPKLRRRVRADLKRAGVPRDKVLALVVSVLAETMIRVGNEGYARDNKSFGLTTLRDRHVRFDAKGAHFGFDGKSGQKHNVALADKRLVKLVRTCQQLPGQTLFQYVDENRKRQPIDSNLVNAYLRGAMGEDFSTKDFRTWAGTLAAFYLCARTPLPEAREGRDAPSERALSSVEKEVCKSVATLLGNTPAVCRKAYIDPSVFAGWRDARVQRAASGATGPRQWEQAALRFLKAAHRKR